MFLCNKFYIQATNNEVKCKINAMKTKMRAGDYERTLNYKWPQLFYNIQVSIKFGFTNLTTGFVHLDEITIAISKQSCNSIQVFPSFQARPFVFLLWNMRGCDNLDFLLALRKSLHEQFLSREFTAVALSSSKETCMICLLIMVAHVIKLYNQHSTIHWRQK